MKFEWIRKLREVFDDPFTGQALVDNAELVFLPVPPIKEEASPMLPVAEFPGVAERIVAGRTVPPSAKGAGVLAEHHRRMRRRTIRGVVGTVASVLGFLLVYTGSGSDDLVILIGIPTLGIMLLFMGLALFKR